MLKFFLISLVLLFSSTVAICHSRKPIALVYRGPGACLESCSESAAEAAELAGYKVHFIAANEINPSVLAHAKLWVQPGGNAIELVKALREEQLAAIRNFVASGGLYVGFCAGAFFTDAYVDDEKTLPGLNLTPGEQFDYIRGDSNAYMLPITWNGEQRDIYFQEGGYIVFAKEAQAKIIATYPNGSIATAVFPYQRGRIAITGVHPEASEQWKLNDNLVDQDGSDINLAVELIHELKVKK